MSEERWDQPLIRNCRFAFRCKQRWNSLEETSDPTVRRCHECVAVPTQDGSALTHTVGVLLPC